VLSASISKNLERWCDMVVNVKDNVKYDVYIGRNKKYGSDYFGNPIKFNAKCIVCGKVHIDNAEGRKALLVCYKIWFWKRINEDEVFYGKCKELKDKTLACHCKPLDCHGDVIEAWLKAGCPRKSK